jgi:hypothetical protein
MALALGPLILSLVRTKEDERSAGRANRFSCRSPLQFDYPVVEEEVEPPDPMFVHVCVDVLLAAVVLDAAVLALLAVPVVVVGFVCADANPIEAIPAIAATTVTMMRE